MKSILFPLIIFLTLPLCAMEETERTRPYIPITTLDMFSEIIDQYTKGLHPRTIAVFDIDDTVGRLCGPAVLESTAYEENDYVAKHLNLKKGDAEKIMALLDAHKDGILCAFDEENTVSKKIKQLQSNGIMVIGLTARSAPLRDRTLKQLKKNLGVQFTYDEEEKPILFIEDEQSIEEKSLADTPLDTIELVMPFLETEDQIKCYLKVNSIKTAVKEKKQMGSFTHGILFCGNNPKGPMLQKLFEKLDLDPDEIIFADDSSRNLDSVLDTFPSKRVIPLLMKLSTPVYDDSDFEEKFESAYLQIGARKIPTDHLFPFLLKALAKSPEIMKQNVSMQNLETSIYSSSSSDGSLSPTGSPPHTSHAPGYDPLALFRSGRK